MQQEHNIASFTKFYALSLLVYVLAMYDVTWLNKAPVTLLRGFIILVCLLKMFGNSYLRISRNQVLPIILLLIYCVYSVVITHSGDPFVTIRYAAVFISMSSVFFLTYYEKLYVLRVFTNGFFVILLISLFGWVLFLLGVSLPHSGLILHSNGFHEYYDYYFFRIASQSLESDFPRFQSIFLEPGQLATPCVFLFYLNSFENKVFGRKNLVLLVAIILSFSLISYGLMLVTFVTIAWTKGARWRVPLTIIVVFVIGGIYYFASSSENNAINALILSRLEYDEETIISGNNRTASVFDANYANFIKSKDKYFGIHKELSSGYNWSNNSSGYKKFIVHEGIVGLVVIMALITAMFLKNKKNAKTFIFFIILVMAFLVRNLLQSPLWLSIAILGFYLLGNENNLKVNPIENNNDSYQVNT